MPDPQRAVTTMLTKLSANPPRCLSCDQECGNFPGKSAVGHIITTRYLRDAGFGSVALYRFRGCREQADPPGFSPVDLSLGWSSGSYGTGLVSCCFWRSNER